MIIQFFKSGSKLSAIPIIFSLTITPVHSISVDAPCSPSDSQFAGCPNPAWGGVDQGTIAESHKEYYTGTIKPQFERYKQEYQSFNDINLQQEASEIEKLKEISTTLAVRLEKWSNTNRDNFTSYFAYLGSNVSPEEVHHNLIEVHLPLFKTQYQQIQRQIVANYFHSNPNMFHKIEYHYYYKSFWPFMGGSGRWGGVTEYEHSDNIERASHYYPVTEATLADHDFSQEEEHFSDKWNNGNTSPTTTHGTSTKYYKLSSIDDTQFIQDLLNVDPASLNDESRTSVNFETLDETRSMIINTTLNLVKYGVVSHTNNQDEAHETLSALLSFLPNQSSLASTTRLINQQFNQCLGISPSNKAKMFDCTSRKGDLDWFVIEQSDGYFSLKNTELNLCLAADQPSSYLVLSECNSDIEKQLWRRQPSSSVMIENKVVDGVIDVFDEEKDGRVGLWQKKQSGQHNQKWSIDLVPANNQEFLTAEYYTEHHPEILLRNFPSLLHSYILLELSDQGNEKIETFFEGVSALSYFGQLPRPIRNISQDVINGESVISAYEQEKDTLLDALKLALVFYPKYWNELTKVGDIHVYNNPYNDDSELITPKFIGNAAPNYYYYPINKESNNYWDFYGTIGNQHQIGRLFSNFKDLGLFEHEGSETEAGKLYLRSESDSENEHIFLSKLSGLNIGNFPNGENSNANWRYIGSGDQGDFIVAAYINYLTHIYLETNINSLELLLSNPAFSGTVDNELPITLEITPPFVGQKLITGISALLTKTESLPEDQHHSISLSNIGAMVFSGFRAVNFARIAGVGAQFLRLLEINLPALEVYNGGYTPIRSEVFQKWGQGEWGVPDEYNEIQSELLRELGSEDEVMRFIDNFEAPMWEVAGLTNNLVSSAFNQIAISQTIIPIVSISTITTVGLFFIP